MKLQADKYYKGTDGTKYGPMVVGCKNSDHPWEEKGNKSIHIWKDDGTSSWDSDPDLIREWGSTISNDFKIPREVADNITLASLKEHYQLSKETLDDWYEGKGWLHRDDIEHQSILLFHLKAVIEYYGGTVE